MSGMVKAGYMLSDSPRSSGHVPLDRSEPTKRKAKQMTVTMTKLAAEQATGCAGNRAGLGKYYNNQGSELTAEEAQDELLEGGYVEVPNAGAGSYRRFFEAMLFEDCKAMETTSSAGDWTLAVKDNGTWYAAWQSNRFPRHGFSYSIDRMCSADSFEELCRLCFS